MVNPRKEIWEQLHQDGYSSFSERTLFNTILKNFTHYLKSTDNVLDIGCGTGDVFDWMHPFIKTYTGIDISQNVCDKITERFKLNTQFIQARPCAGNGLIPIINNEYFDVVFSCLVFQHIHIKFIERYVSESRRVLVPNGLFMFHTTEWPTSKTNDYFKLNQDDAAEIDYLKGGVYNHSYDVVKPILDENGFKLIDFGKYQDERLKKEKATWLMFVARKI